MSDLAMLIQLLDPSLYPDLHQQLVGSILGQEPSSIQASEKSVQLFLCDLADNPTNQQTNMGKNITSLADVMEQYCPICQK